MKMILVKYLVFVSTVFILLGCQNAPYCEKFKEGDFTIQTEDIGFDYLITRLKHSQIEKNEDGEEAYYSIEWLDECSYISKFDKTKMTLTDEMKMVNSDGGMVVELLEAIDDNCIAFQSYVKKYKEVSLRNGKFCRTTKDN